MKDLYTTLNLPRDATKEQIRKAYRAEAKKHHPDKGGDPALFAQIKLAHDILTDDERRAKYDATGNAEETEPDNHRAEAMQRLHTAINNAVQIAWNKSSNPLALDILQLAKKNLVDHITQVEQQKAAYVKKQEFYTKLAARFKKDGGDDPIALLLARDIRECDTAIASCEGEVARGQATLKLFEGYRFDRDVPPAPMQQPQGFLPTLNEYKLRTVLSETPP